jgi:diamine N-acetyltransferase
LDDQFDVRGIGLMGVRQLNTADASKLAELARTTYVAAFGHTFSSKDLSAYINKTLSDDAILRAFRDDVFLGAEVQSELVGFVQFGAASIDGVPHAQGDQALRRIYVRADFQRKGFGSSLLNAGFQHT